MKSIDINSDLGEGFGPYRIADDDALLGVVSSANIACGFHAGDPVIMDATVATAAKFNVDIGAHVGFDDRMGFGRRKIHMSSKELEKITLYQLGALYAFARVHGRKVTHMSPHGALGNMSFVDTEISTALMTAAKAFDPKLIIVTMPHTEAAKAAESAGLRVARLFLSDRAYTDEGVLVPRGQSGAVIKDLPSVEKRVTELLTEGTVTTISGKKLKTEVESILIHSDTPGAVEVAQKVRAAITAANAKVTPLSTILG